VKEFFVGLIFLLAAFLLIGAGFLLFPLLVVMAFFGRLIIMVVLGIFSVWLLGKFIIFVWEKMRG